MGLDQYANYRPPYTGQDAGTLFTTWRKHNRLQGWMKNLFFVKKEGFGKEFNCVEIQITLEDLDELENAINNRGLPKTEGFFFGDDSYDDYEYTDLETDLQFIKDARKHINDGNEVFYSSWW